MPSARAASSAFSRLREAMAATSLHSPFCIAGITFRTAILATPRTPHRTLFRTEAPPSFSQVSDVSSIRSKTRVADDCAPPRGSWRLWFIRRKKRVDLASVDCRVSKLGCERLHFLNSLSAALGNVLARYGGWGLFA